MSLRLTMAKGVMWSLIEKGGAQIVSFVVFTIIARLLGPEEYGLVNICYVYLALASVVVFSIADGVINLNITDDRRLSTLFWTTLASGVGMGVLFFWAAEPFAAFMEDPRLVPLLQWFAFFPILLSLSALPTVLITASMNFYIITIRTLAASLVSGIAGVTMALDGYGAYAIVAQQVAYTIVINLVLWPGCKWRPKFMFDRKALAEIISPGLKMTGLSLISFFEQQAPRLIIGSVLGPTAVGHFGFVYRLRQALHEVLGNTLSAVLYPAFARLKDNHDEQNRMLSQLIVLSGLLVFPCITGAIVTAPLYVPLIFGEAWSPAIPVLQLFLVTGATLPFYLIMRDLLRAHNLTGPFLRVQTILVSIGLAATLILASEGLWPVALGLVTLAVLSLPVYTHLVFHKTGFALGKQYLKLWPPVVASALMGAAVLWFDQSAFASANMGLKLAEEVLLGGVIYSAVCLVLLYRQIVSLWAFVNNWRRNRTTEPKTTTSLSI